MTNVESNLATLASTGTSKVNENITGTRTDLLNVQTNLFNSLVSVQGNLDSVIKGESNKILTNLTRVEDGITTITNSLENMDDKLDQILTNIAIKPADMAKILEAYNIWIQANPTATDDTKITFVVAWMMQNGYAK